MKGVKGLGLAAALGAALLAIWGCQEGAKSAVKVKPPVSVPPATASAVAKLGDLPIPSASPDLSALSPSTRPAVDALIAQVQASYDAGQAAYKAGDLEAARKDFNAALNHLMKSRLETTGDVRLQQLFNQIVDTMQDYELSVEKQDEATTDSSDEDNGDTDTDTDTSEDVQPPSPDQPTAPIEEIANMESLPATDPRLAALAEKELVSVPHDLPLTVNASVLQYLSFFESPRGREIVEMGLQRAGRYRAMIESTLKQEGLPQDLIYLAQAESAFKPRAVSSKGARGVWQFMPYTGAEYGLDRNYWVDERDDPTEATRAAAEHLRDLYQMFGDWYLVMAAYNSGPLNVARAVEHTGYADFWELQRRNALPAQTKDYVPIILALALVAKDPPLYGIHVDPDAPTQFDAIELKHSISLRLVSDATGTSLDDLQALNPELIRGITPAAPDFALRVPQGTGEELQKAVSAIPPDKWTTWRLAKLGPDQTLGEVAREFHVTLASLENANMIDPHDPPATGTELVVPAAPPRLRLVHYRVKRGDTLDDIASRYSVSTAELQRWNHLRTEHAPRGRLLRIYEEYYPTAAYATERSVSTASRRRSTAGAPAAAKTAAHNGEIVHRVEAGETLWSIAHEYGTTVDAIKQSNPFLGTRGLQVGDRLHITPRQ
ncbi:MAG TPA: LysM peptidoglycan-binding domain-containing protein [Candidatus Acidoferrales bacterium]|nr:LysM peptidoglycan-binding domain-containing protein [Candidatus Acidoferrales bacterium]